MLKILIWIVGFIILINNSPKSFFFHIEEGQAYPP